MKTQDLEFFKTLLSKRLEELVSHADGTVTGMTQPIENFADPTDRASHEAERSFELRIRDRERKLLSKIEDALIRIDEGEYGICEECGCDINVKRLEARPVTTLCIDCKTLQEKKEKSQGQ